MSDSTACCTATHNERVEVKLNNQMNDQRLVTGDPTEIDAIVSLGKSFRCDPIRLNRRQSEHRLVNWLASSDPTRLSIRPFRVGSPDTGLKGRLFDEGAKMKLLF